HSWGTQQQRYQRIRELSQLLWQQLNDLPHVDCIRQLPPESGLVSFQINHDVAKSVIAQNSHGLIARQLESEYQVFIRALPEPDCLRASVHYLTTMADIERIVSIIASLA
ncbi:MAG: cysteine lyase, partial [Pseudanabaena sp.]